MAKNSDKRIIVAVDFSKTSRAALQHAIDLGREAGGAVDVVYVIEDSFQATLPWLKQGRETVKQMRADAVRAATEKLEKFVPKVADLEVTTTVKTGEVDEEVLKIAKRKNAALIVLGKVGRRRMDEFFIGSSANDIIRLSPIPVLLVPVPN